MLRVAYNDGEEETWPITEAAVLLALRRRSAPAVPHQAPSFAFRRLHAQPVWAPSQAGEGVP